MRSTRRKSAMSAKLNRESLRLNIAPIHDDGLIPNYGYEYTLHNFGHPESVDRPIWGNNWGYNLGH